jgi:hypothetical protein
MGPGATDAVVVLAVSGWVVASWSFPGARPVDLASVDALARVTLAAHRAGGDARLLGCPAQMRALLELAGLDERLLLRPNGPAGPAGAAASVEVVGEPERLEQRSVEEAVVADDPVA